MTAAATWADGNPGCQFILVLVMELRHVGDANVSDFASYDLSKSGISAHLVEHNSLLLVNMRQ